MENIYHEEKNSNINLLYDYFMDSVTRKHWRSGAQKSYWWTTVLDICKKERDRFDSLVIRLPWQKIRNAPMQKIQCQYKGQETHKESILANNISTALT